MPNQVSKTSIRGMRLPLLYKGIEAGAFLKFRNAIISAVNSFCNIKVLIVRKDGVSVEADVKQTEMATVITFPNQVFDNSSGSSSSASVQQFKIVSDGGDYWNCKTWDGTTLGSSIVKVAKPYKLRISYASETIGSVTYNYTYSAVTAGGVVVNYSRSVSGTDGTSGTDYLIPSSAANDIIYGVTFSTATPASLADVTYIDLNIDARAYGQ